MAQFWQSEQPHARAQTAVLLSRHPLLPPSAASHLLPLALFLSLKKRCPTAIQPVISEHSSEARRSHLAAILTGLRQAPAADRETKIRPAGRSVSPLHPADEQRDHHEARHRDRAMRERELKRSRPASAPTIWRHKRWFRSATDVRRDGLRTAPALHYRPPKSRDRHSDRAAREDKRCRQRCCRTDHMDRCRAHNAGAVRPRFRASAASIPSRPWARLRRQRRRFPPQSPRE